MAKTPDSGLRWDRGDAVAIHASNYNAATGAKDALPVWCSVMSTADYDALFDGLPDDGHALFRHAVSNGDTAYYESSGEIVPWPDGAETRHAWWTGPDGTMEPVEVLAVVRQGARDLDGCVMRDSVARAPKWTFSDPRTAIKTPAASVDRTPRKRRAGTNKPKRRTIAAK